jgi:hypothetical protein
MLGSEKTWLTRCQEGSLQERWGWVRCGGHWKNLTLASANWQAIVACIDLLSITPTKAISPVTQKRMHTMIAQVDNSRYLPETVLLVRSKLASGMAVFVMLDTRPHAEGREPKTPFPDRLKLMGRAKADHALGRLPAMRLSDRSRLLSVVTEAHWSLRGPLRAFRDRLT